MFPPLIIFPADPLFTSHREDCEKIYYFIKQLWEEGKYAQALALLRKNEREHQAGSFFAALRLKTEHILGIKNTANENKINFLPSAVLLETNLCRIPGIIGEEIASLCEGQPVLVYPVRIGSKNSWLRVVTNDLRKISGWVPEEKVIF